MKSFTVLSCYTTCRQTKWRNFCISWRIPVKATFPARLSLFSDSRRPSFKAQFVSGNLTRKPKCWNKSALFLLHLIMDFRIQEFIAFRRFKSAQVVDKHTCPNLSVCHRDQADGLPCTLHVKHTLVANKNCSTELQLNGNLMRGIQLCVQSASLKQMRTDTFR